MRRYGVTLPMETVPPSDYPRVAARVAALGYTDVWSGEAAYADGVTPLAAAVAAAPSLRVGTAILPVQTRGPAVLAMTAATLGAMAPGGFVLGVGSSGPLFVEQFNGIPFTEPLDRVRETVRFLRTTLSGGTADGDYGSFSVGGFRLSLPPSDVPVMVAALRPGMLRLAVEEADGAIINFLSAEDVRTVRAAAGPAGADKEWVARLFVCPTTDADHARDLGRRIMTGVLTSPNYTAFHRWLGRGDLLEPSAAAVARGDWPAAVAALPDELVDQLLIHGSPAEVRDRVAAYVDAGVTTPVLAIQPAPEFGEGTDAMLAAAEALAPR